MTAVIHRPTVRVQVNGTEMPNDDLATLVSLTVCQRLSFPSQLTATFIEAGTSYDNSDAAPVAEIDDELLISLEDGTALFAGRVVGREREWNDGGVSTTTVRAYDWLHELRTDRTARRHPTSLLAETCAAITSDYDLTCVFEADDIDFGEPILQYAESDFALLHRLASRSGLDFICNGETVSFFSDELSLDPIELAVGTDLMQVGIDERVAEAVDEPNLIGWHESQQEPVHEGSSESGALSGGWLVTPISAEAQAESIRRHAERNLLMATGVAVGTAELSPGRRCRIRFDESDPTEDVAEVIITSVWHRFSTADGYVSEFTSEATTDVPKPSTATYTIGRIVDLDDPDARGRIRVALTAYDDIETGWLAAILPGSGVERGVIAIPDVDDFIVVLGPSDDVGRGVVLGGIAAGRVLAGQPIESDSNSRLVVRLPNGAAMTLENDGLRIDDGFGSSLDLREDRVSLHSAADLEITAPGKRVLISGNLIDFERS